MMAVVLGIVFAGGCIIYGCFIPRWKMKQLYEPDYQNMPLCPVSREPVTLLPQEPPTPIGQTVDFHPTANAASDLQVPHATEMIV
ncbi:hypothetical protein J437_LFUL009766 [Ladona fulva]|uniref:Uncharacterized protein n=1 Tax=Ladona fulva TaxID=123851 RepID=A0A8K0K8W5_LADFU|nr:hypothetical protein J437_LFUL009766 [Ladona fulva]